MDLAGGDGDGDKTHSQDREMKSTGSIRALRRQATTTVSYGVGSFDSCRSKDVSHNKSATPRSADLGTFGGFGGGPGDGQIQASSLGKVSRQLGGSGSFLSSQLIRSSLSSKHHQTRRAKSRARRWASPAEALVPLRLWPARCNMIPDKFSSRSVCESGAIG